MNRRVILLLVLAAALWAGCKSQYEMLLSGNDIPAKYKAAFEYFNTKKYKKAASMFESLSLLTSGMPQDDTVRYYWALSNYNYKDFTTAEANFKSFIDLYPRSPFTPEARFLKVDCMYRDTYRYELDQSPTNLAIIAISEYVLEYPDNEHRETCQKMLDDLKARLDTKAFEAARLYYKMEDYIASRTAFKNILKDNADNIYREQILYYIAKSNYKYAHNSVASKQKERYMEFTDSYFNFIGEYPDSDLRKELDQLYARAQKSTGGTADLSESRQRRLDKQADRAAEKTIRQSEKGL